MRYAALLVDPFSPADEQGRHFDFSAVPFRRVSRDEDGLWRLPRVPLEDYRKLALIVALAAHFDLAMPQARSLLASYENAVSRFIDCQGASQCHPSLYPIDSRPAADAIYRQWCSTC